MRISRLHVDQPLTSGARVSADGDLAHYVINVLRLKSGMPCRVFNSRDGEFAATIDAAGKQQLTLTIGAAIECHANPALKLHLGLGLSRGERMDFAIQKSTELGVSSITPLFTERCEVKLAEARIANRLQHWQRIAINACEQCGRTVVPVINPPQNLQSWLLANPGGIVLDQDGDRTIDSLNITDSATLLIGPEGGLSDVEVQCAVKSGFFKLRLGPRILRTETAPLAALSVLQYLYGDF